MRLAPQIHDLLIDLGLCGIGMDRSGDGLRSGAGFHRNGKLADHVAGMGRHDRCSYNLVRALLNVDPRKALVFSVKDRTIDLIEFVRVGFDFDPLLLCILLVHPDMRHFRLREGTPGHDRGIRPWHSLSPRDEGIARSE